MCRRSRCRFCRRRIATGRRNRQAIWGEQNGVLLHFIPKGSPQSNALIERFNRGFREYNEARPHDSLDDRPRWNTGGSTSHERRKSLRTDVQLTGGAYIRKVVCT